LFDVSLFQLLDRDVNTTAQTVD